MPAPAQLTPRESEAGQKSSDKRRTPTKAELDASPRAERSKSELYAEARRRGIEGRSTMTKAELQRALDTR